MANVLSATEARNRFFEILDLVRYKGEEIIIEKDSKPVVKLSPVSATRSPEEIDRILLDMRKIFAKSAKRKYWSVIDTPAWKKKEAKYLEDLKSGIIQ